MATIRGKEILDWDKEWESLLEEIKSNNYIWDWKCTNCEKWTFHSVVSICPKDEALA